MKFKTYKGETLKDVLVTYKIDGVRAHKTPEVIVSRAGKPLYNITMDCDVAEVFLGSWEASVSAARTHLGTPIAQEHIYSLQPTLDSRLIVGNYPTLTASDVDALFHKAKELGYEGLVLYSEDKMYKVKGKETYDVVVLQVLSGTGRNASRMGAVVTPMGKVGLGFSDLEREAGLPLGSIIEVECMELTPKGKFRQPRFIRRRVDKE